MTAQPVTRTTPAAPPATGTPARRGRAAARAAVVLLVLLVVANIAGVVMFGLVWPEDPVGPGLVYLAMVVVTGLTALAAAPSLLRGERTGWSIVTAWAVAYEYWTVYKVFGMPEWISLPHLVVCTVLLGLLALPSVRPVAGDR